MIPIAFQASLPNSSDGSGGFDGGGFSWMVAVAGFGAFDSREKKTRICIFGLSFFAFKERII